jgi:hypothetical protein
MASIAVAVATVDPNLTYAELKFGTNIVIRVFTGETIPDWAMQRRTIVLIPKGADVKIGDRYHEGVFERFPTAAQVQVGLSNAVQKHLDDKARERGYDNIFTAVSYADEPEVVQFQQEGLAYRKWRSQVWSTCYQRLGLVQKGLAAVPTEAELIALLPAIVLPPVALS